MSAQHTQVLAASTLLEKGVFVDRVKAPIFLRLIGWSHIELTLYQSNLAELVEIGEIIASMNLSDEQLKNISLTESYAIISGAAQGAMQVMLIAARLKVPLWSRSRLARYILARISAERFAKAWRYYVAYSGVQDFTNTIRLMVETNFLSPMERRSQTAAG